MKDKSKQVIKHVRDVNNYLRTEIVSGSDLSVEAERDAVIQKFLDNHTTTTGKMTPELFLFFLQKVNTHCLFEELDNDSYAITFPSYIPFDPAVVAEQYGFKDIVKVIETNLIKRSSNIGHTKVASAAVRELGGIDYLDKVASSQSSSTSMFDYDELKKQCQDDKLDEVMDHKRAAVNFLWKFSNVEDFTKTSVFKCNYKYTKLLKELQGKNIMGNKDKVASISDFNGFMDTLDKIIELTSK